MVISAKKASPLPYFPTDESPLKAVQVEMNHFNERKLNLHSNTDSSWVVWTRHEPKGAVVFVHGYMGEATSTWTAFQSLLPPRGKAKHYDLFFYGYNCITSNTMAQGRLFCDFLDKLWISPESLASGSLPSVADRQRKFRYDKVVLVGHSIGAVICRRALLFAHGLGHRWMPRTSMILFAPAHSGAIASEIIKDLGTLSWLKLFINWRRYATPLIDEVAPGSQSIVQLEQDTINAIEGGAKYLIAKKVIIAEVERVVSNLQFLRDPVPIAIPGTTHSTVCKPSSSFTQPIDQVEQVL